MIKKNSEWVNSIKKKMHDARQVKDWKKCIQICRSALRENFLDNKDWVGLRKCLAVFLLESDTKQNLDEVINIYKEILSKVDSKKAANIIASTHRDIAYAYSEKVDINSRRLAIEHSEQALKFYTLKRYPEDWALIKSMLGMYHHGLWSDSKKEKDFLAALKNYNEALQVLNQKQYPENWKEITELIKELEEKKGARN